MSGVEHSQLLDSPKTLAGSPQTQAGSTPVSILLISGTVMLAEYLRVALPHWVERIEIIMLHDGRPMPAEDSSWQTIVVAVTSPGDASQRFLNGVLVSGCAARVVVVDATAPQGLFTARSWRRVGSEYRPFSSVTFEPDTSLPTFQAWLEATLLLEPSLSHV